MVTAGKTYSEIAYDLLRGEILRGDLRPGDRLVEQDLAGRFGMSQGPIREALSRLEAQGLILSLRHRGSFVSEISEDEARDIYAVRRHLEKYAVTLALPRMTDSDIDDLRGRIDGIVRLAKSDFLKMLEVDMAWHRQIYVLSGSPTLLRFWEIIEAQTLKFQAVAARHVFHDPVAIAETHWLLTDAMAARDLDRLLGAVEEHVMRIWTPIETDSHAEDDSGVNNQSLCE